MGRPSKYETEVKDKLILVEGWARDGLTEDQIAKNLGIGRSTLSEYKNQYPDFLEALKKGKEVADFMVENALFKRALGYQYEEVTTEMGTETKRVVKEVAPDTTAQIYWLKNRRPDKWRDKPDSEEKLKKVIALLGKLNLSPEEIDELVSSL